MSRPLKQGLEYFPLDIDIEQDDKIFDLEVEMGLEGFALLIKLYIKIYHNSYYTEWGNIEEKRFAKQNSISLEQVHRLIEFCCNSEIFSKELYERHKVLSSRGIQRRYLQATLRRHKVELIQKYLLTEINEYNNVVIVHEDVNINKIEDSNNKVNVGIMLHNDNSNSQSKVKESKVIDICQAEPDSIPYGEIIDYLNLRTGANYKASSKHTQKHIKARWKEGFRLEDFKKVTDLKCSQWLNSDMAAYLRPETLFGSKFENYLNAPNNFTLDNNTGINNANVLYEPAFELDESGTAIPKIKEV